MKRVKRTQRVWKVWRGLVFVTAAVLLPLFVAPVFGEENGESMENSEERIEEKEEEEECKIPFVVSEKGYDIRFNEIRVTGGSGKTKQDFIELYNFGDEEIDVGGWSIRKNATPKDEDEECDESGSIKKFNADTILKAGNFLIWANSGDGYAEDLEKGIPDGTLMFSTRNSVSDGNEILLRDSDDEIVDRIILPDKAQKKTYAFDEDDEEWKWVCNETPGEENDFGGFDGEKTIRLSEVLASPTDEEFIEIENFGDEEVDVSEWVIADKKNDDNVGDLLGDADPKMKSGEYRILSLSGSGVSANDSDEEIELRDPCGGKVDSFSYKDITKGKSWAFDGEKWRETPYVTEGGENMFPKSQKGAKVRISEVLANPEGDEETEEYIELENFGGEEISIEYWELADATGKNFIFSEEAKLAPGEFLAVYRKDFDFALNNGEETVTLRDAAGTKIDEAVFETAKEGVSWNWHVVEKVWRASKHLTPGKENRYNHRPEIRDFDVPREAYDGVKAEFSVKAEDRDGEELSFRWEFGNGRRSYKEDTTHIYRDEGKKYTVTLRVTDGVEDVFRSETLEVVRFPRRDIRFVAFMPNPAGKDTEGEWIEVRNDDEKKINLLGWSIATGKDDDYLANHPIRKSIVLDEGETARISREDCAFSLRNTSGALELRRPDGSAADEVSYAKEKIIDDEVYRLGEDGEWYWEGEAKETTTPDEELQGEESADEVVVEESEPFVLGAVSEGEAFVHPALVFFDIEKTFRWFLFKNSLDIRGKSVVFTKTGTVPDRHWWERCMFGACPEG